MRWGNLQSISTESGVGNWLTDMRGSRLNRQTSRFRTLFPSDRFDLTRYLAVQ
jgi:hypothetical protein